MNPIGSEISSLIGAPEQGGAIPLPAPGNVTPPPGESPEAIMSLIRQLQELAQSIASRYPAFADSAHAIMQASTDGMMRVVQTMPTQEAMSRPY